jgi:hypothetical protein
VSKSCAGFVSDSRYLCIDQENQADATLWEYTDALQLDSNDPCFRYYCLPYRSLIDSASTAKATQKDGDQLYSFLSKTRETNAGGQAQSLTCPYQVEPSGHDSSTNTATISAHHEVSP